MATKSKAEKPKPQINWREMFNNPLVYLLSAIFIILGAAAYYIVYVAIPDKIKAEMVEQVKPDGLLTSLVNTQIGTTAKQVEKLTEAQGTMHQKLTELDIKFDLYFGNQVTNKKAAESTVERAVDTVGSSRDNNERTVALKVAGNVLEKAAAHHVVVDYKKINKYGMALLTQQYSEDQKGVIRQTLAHFANQRTLKLNPPKNPSRDGQVIADQDVRLDGAKFENVTFVNCKIFYDNGWLGLKNVRFINCRFDVLAESPGFEFYKTLFGSEEPIPVVNLQTPGPPPKAREGS